MRKALLFVLALCLMVTAVPTLAAQPPDAVITYELDREANVSLAVYDASGRRIRELLRAERQQPGKHQVIWDGLDRDGNPVAGNFQWRLATSQGLKSEYLLSIGTSLRHNIWPAQHGPLCAVQTDGSRIFVTAGMSEGAPQTGCISIDGQWQWVSGPTGGWMGGIDLALDGDTLYFLGGPMCADARLFVQQAQDGHGKPGLRNTVNWGEYPTWQVEKYDKPRRVDARDGELIIAAPSGLIVWLDPQTGEERGRLSVEGGLEYVALLGGGRVLVISGDSVVEVARGKAERVTRITAAAAAALTSPHRIAIDPVSGDIFVAEAGKSQQVKRFNPDYKMQRALGRAGGRKTGIYKPEDFLEVSGIAGDGKGGFLVTETSGPRRTAHFNANGKLVNEWYGGQSFYTYVSPETDNPDYLWMHSDGWLTRLKADYQGGSWRPLATYRFADAIDQNLITAGFGSGGFQVKRLDLTGDGRIETYLWSKSTTPLVLKVDEAAGLLRPVAAMGTVPEKFVVPGDASRQVQIPGVDKPESWTLLASVQWAIYHAGQHGWLEVLDADGKAIVSLYLFRGEAKQNITSNAGHTNYVVFNNGELMNANNPNWKLTGAAQDVEITVADGVATVKYGGEIKLERPVLEGDWKSPARLSLRTTRGGSINATKAAFVYRAGGQRHEIAIDIEGAQWTRPPVEPAVWADAIRLLGKDPEDNAIRQQHQHFAWADANGDYTIQAQELRLGASGGGSVLFTDDAFNVYLRSDAADGPDYRVITPVGRTQTGNPIWDWGRLRPGPNTPFSQTRSLWVDEKGNVYQTSAYGGDGYNHQWQWPATFVNATAVVKTAPDGTMLWQAGERAGRMPHPRGQMHYPINTLGTVHGCIGFADYIANPAEFWTEDGLYIGGVFDRHAEGPHPRVYSWWRYDRSVGDDYNTNIALLQYDLLLGGNLARHPNGDVLYFACGWNNMPVYRVTGWDEISRQQGTVAAPAAPRAAARKGTGLRAQYFANERLEGDPGLTRLDERIWFDEQHAWPQEPSSVRWMGAVEPVVSGRHTFSVYPVNSGARLWIGGRIILDRWQDSGKFWSQPIELKAGHRYPIRMEMRRIGDNPQAHLNWEALDLPIEHVPQTALYPESPAAVLSIRPVSTVVTRGSGTPVQFVFERTGPTDAPLAVPFKLEGTARPGVDYRPLRSESITIGVGKRDAGLNVVPIEGPALKWVPTLRLVVEPSEDYIIDEQIVPEVALRMPRGAGYRRYDQILAARNYADVFSLDVDKPLAEWELSGMVDLGTAHAGNHAYLEVVDAEGKVIASLYMYRGEAKEGITRPRGHANYVVFNDAEVEMSPDQIKAMGERREFAIAFRNGKMLFTHESGIRFERPVLQGDATRPAFARARSNAATAAVRATIERLTCRLRD
ncbi:MAG TPA: PA14 domain-containing protein [Planctomycetota bacterium]|nr:PA14 domain-containing protein [Planctomycetota bacterium]